MPVIKEQLERDLKDAMFNKDKVRMTTIRSLRAALLEKEIEERKGGEATLTEEQELAVLQKQAKQRRDAAEQYDKAGRDDLAGREREELAIISGYLPAQLSDEEIRSALHGIIAGMGSPSPQLTGRVTGEAMRQLRGKADGRRVQAIAREMLGS